MAKKRYHYCGKLFIPDPRASAIVRKHVQPLVRNSGRERRIKVSVRIILDTGMAGMNM